MLIVAGPEALEDNLAGANTTRNDLRARPRESNVARSEQVLAVIFKTTGYVTVIHGEGPLDPDLLEGARGAERLRPRT